MVPKKKALKNKKDERGFFVIWALGLGMALLAIGILTLDFWHIFSVRRSLNDIADSAAVVGSQQIYEEHFEQYGKVILRPLDDVGPVVCDYLRKNSPATDCSDSRNQVSMIVDDAGDNIGVTVRLSQDVDYRALRFLPAKDGGFESRETVNASSSARVEQLDP